MNYCNNQKEYINDIVTYLSGQDEIMCCNIWKLVMFIALIIVEIKSISEM